MKTVDGIQGLTEIDWNDTYFFAYLHSAPSFFVVATGVSVQFSLLFLLPFFLLTWSHLSPVNSPSFSLFMLCMTKHTHSHRHCRVGGGRYTPKKTV